MKRFVMGGLAILIVALTAASALGAIKFGPEAGFCQADEEINSAQQASINKAAMSFATTLLSSHPESAHDMMTQEGRASVPVDKFGTTIKQFVQMWSPLGTPKIIHTYLPILVGGSSESRVICGELGGTNWVSVAAKPGIRQAYSVASVKSRNNDLALTMWLWATGDAWQVQRFDIHPSSTVGHTPDDLLKLARQQDSLGHKFNALFLYVGALGLMDRGPDFQLGLLQTVRSDLKKFVAPPELRGKAPFKLNMNGNNFSVAQISIMGVQGDLGLVFVLPSKTWTGEQDADKSNRVFLDAFVATHPDFTPTFKFLLARAMKPDGSGGFGTVYQVGKGYLR